MRISEIFYSLQGEGFLAGMPSVFVRLAGCPLRCRWCDTKYAWSLQVGEDYSIDKILKAVQRFESNFVVITGGEPMVSSELSELVRSLKNHGKHITIETAGIVYIPDMDCDLMSISPKLSNSVPIEPELAEGHKDSMLDIAALAEIIDNYNYQLKFVVDSEDDLAEINGVVKKLGNIDLTKVMLMPQAARRKELLAKSFMVAEMCRQSGFAFCNRLQVLLWGDVKGK